ncbi:helix-turn-helix domain-containing protein [Salipaludibacillus neizhouensis]|uniref:PucR family transcriptional regulator n=1 Tax=Salipaludibacillus neizhouensis TaxID=885475 RepID=UPI00167D1699|nr:helix-turn-helix domain-containing protein [Salipaludibacillus neizhouensis]
MKPRKCSSGVYCSSPLSYYHEHLLRQFAEKELGNSLKYNLENDTELTKTPYVYLVNECNMYKTAKELNLSVSGFRYRLKRILEIYPKNIQSAEIFQLFIPLKYILTNELEITP